jgi:hypothetical protein
MTHTCQIFPKLPLMYNLSMKEIYITKADGSRELFNVEKFEKSLSRSGTSPDTIRKISSHIGRELEDGMSTSIIYDHAFYLLRKEEEHTAARYSLKRALAELGPSGFPFEKFMAEVFRARGYRVENNQFIKGRCAEHEIDLIAWNENKLFMAEAKFHNEIGLKSDLKVALYVKARFDDLKSIEFFYGKKRLLDQGWLITNTKFTDRAIDYCVCSGIRLIGWNYPAESNLHALIEDVGLHPVTCLTTLSVNQKKNLLDGGVVLCRDVRNPELLRSVGVPTDKVQAVVNESNHLCPVEPRRPDRFQH